LFRRWHYGNVQRRNPPGLEASDASNAGKGRAFLSAQNSQGRYLLCLPFFGTPGPQEGHQTAQDPGAAPSKLMGPFFAHHGFDLVACLSIPTRTKRPFA